VEILLAAIMLFVFRQGSRNALNNKAKSGGYRKAVVATGEKISENLHA
jgi:hypothetical protein